MPMPRPIARGGSLGAGRPAEGSGLGVAIACVVAAMLLYLVAALAWDFDDDGSDGLLGANRTGAIITMPG